MQNYILFYWCMPIHIWMVSERSSFLQHLKRFEKTILYSANLWSEDYHRT
jgi:hypothetical protein